MISHCMIPEHDFPELEYLQPYSVCGPPTVLLTSKISFLFFPLSNPTHTTETGSANGGRLLTATHLDQSNHQANQQQMLGFAMSFASLSILCKNARPKPF